MANENLFGLSKLTDISWFSEFSMPNVYDQGNPYSPTILKDLHESIEAGFWSEEELKNQNKTEYELYEEYVEELNEYISFEGMFEES